MMYRFIVVYVVTAGTADVCVCVVIDCSFCTMHTSHKGVLHVLKTLPWPVIACDLHLL